MNQKDKTDTDFLFKMFFNVIIMLDMVFINAKNAY